MIAGDEANTQATALRPAGRPAPFLSPQQFTDWAKEKIANRASAAGMEYDPEDIITGELQNATVVMLRRAKEPVYDELGERDGWRYKDLAWIEYRRPETGRVDEQSYFLTTFDSRLVLLCPWLCFLRFPDGTVKYEG